MLAPGLFVWNQFVTVPDEATEVEVVGQQWQWSFRLPGQGRPARHRPTPATSAPTTRWA